MTQKTREFLRAATEHALNGDVGNASTCLKSLEYWSKIEGVTIPPATIAEIRHTMHLHDGADALDQALGDARHSSIQLSHRFSTDAQYFPESDYAPLLDSTMKHIELERYTHGFPRALKSPTNTVKSAAGITAHDMQDGISMGYGIKSALSQDSAFGIDIHASPVHDPVRRVFTPFNHPQLNSSSFPWRFEEGKITRRV